MSGHGLRRRQRPIPLSSIQQGDVFTCDPIAAVITADLTACARVQGDRPRAWSIVQLPERHRGSPGPGTLRRRTAGRPRSPVSHRARCAATSSEMIATNVRHLRDCGDLAMIAWRIWRAALAGAGGEFGCRSMPRSRCRRRERGPVWTRAGRMASIARGNARRHARP
jgi:hypothetical protein